ncbi:hypothetical protein CEY15_02340 [Dietzia natronolimnaea]|uniref:Uncharacterized protein n=1 Tax=Dietzia natronolimnaea TaxID=161920 RepID=A0A2A2WU32_9ACTN|nr:hypothetical protein [Dietzia natronolimnaea]PAY24655.1 hypothetical protein CEY15_02340 [Dietzia natronolimnaea]
MTIELTDDQVATLAAALGLDTTDPAADDLVAAILAGREPAETDPDLTTVEASTLTELQTLAADGLKWRDRQRHDRAETVVAAAMDANKITAASRARWVQRMLVDPDDTEVTLSRLPADLIPRSEIGRGGSDALDEDTGDTPRWVR